MINLARCPTDKAVADLLGMYRMHILRYERAEKELRLWEHRQSKGLPCAGLLEIVRAEMAAAASARLKLENAVNEVPDERLKLVLQLRYIDGLTIEEAAASMFIDIRWFQRLQKKALAFVKPSLLGEISLCGSSPNSPTPRGAA